MQPTQHPVDPVPPLAPWLAGAVAATRPVRTRHPRATLAWVGGLGVAALLALLTLRVGLRPDLPALPPAPLVLYLAVAVGGFVAQLWAALVPPRGAVLPSGRRATRAALALSALTTVLSLAAGLEWNGLAPVAHGPFWPPAAACLALSALFLITPALLGLLALERLTPPGPTGAVLAVTGAAGALAGLGLTLHCPRADFAHVVVAHGLPMVLPLVVAAALGALAAARRP